MTYIPKILALAGSLREGSYNHQLSKIAVAAAEAAGGKVTHIRLRDYPLPLFDEDLEKAGFPDNALRLKQIMHEHQGLLIASPEYNSSITAVLKNTIDWTSRATPGDPSLACYAGRVAALMSASPGGLGGLRGLVHVRAILGNIGVLVLPEQVALSAAHQAFDEQGKLKDPARQAAVERLGANLVAMLRKLHG